MVSNPIVLTSEPAAVSTSGPKPTSEARDGSPFVEIFNQEVRKEITDKTSSLPDSDRPYSRDKTPIQEEVTAESYTSVRDDDSQNVKSNRQDPVSVDTQLGVVQAVISGQLIVAAAPSQTESAIDPNAEVDATGGATTPAIASAVAPAVVPTSAPGTVVNNQALSNSMFAGSSQDSASTLTNDNQMQAGENIAPVENNNLSLNNPETNLQVQVSTRFSQVLASAQTQGITTDNNAQPSENPTPPASNPGTKVADNMEPVIENAKAAVEQIIATRASSQASTGRQTSESTPSHNNPNIEQGIVDTKQAQTTQTGQANLNQTPQTVSATTQPVDTQTLAGSSQKASPAKEAADPPEQPPANKITSGAEIADTSKTMGAPPGIRINEPARLAEARSQHPVLQVANQLENMATSGIKTLRMQLYPEALGKLELQLTSQGGALKVVILADQATSQQTLERHAQDLQQTLQQNGINLSSLTIGQRGVGDQTGGEQQKAYNSTPNKSLLKDQPDEDTDANKTQTKVTRSSISSTSTSSLEYWV